MFINFLIVIFTVFIVYLFFSNESILEGMKKKGKSKLKTGKKRGIKKANKGKKAVAATTVSAAVSGAVPITDPIALLETVDKLSKTISAQQKELEVLTEQINNNNIAAADAIPKTTSDDTAEEEEEDGDLGI